MKVLHCNPASEEDQIWLPYAWGRFREYCDHRSEYDLSSIQWLDPIYMGWFDVDKLIADIDWKQVDVLLLSFYVWNEERQLEIAKIAKYYNDSMLWQAARHHLVSLCLIAVEEAWQHLPLEDLSLIHI